MRIYKGMSYSRETIFKVNLRQGDLVYIMHPSPDRRGWYQKLRRDTNAKVGYFQITGKKAGETFVAGGGLERPNFRYGIDSRAVLFVKGGDNVSAFIASDFTMEELVEDPGLKHDIMRLEEMEDAIEELRKDINSRRHFNLENN